MSLSESNPYESPSAVESAKAAEELRRPPFGTFLLGLWILEGGFKAFVVGSIIARGTNPFAFIASGYDPSQRLLFVLVSSFLVVETIGPWIGIYYLTGRRARTIPFERALLRTLKVACLITIVMVVVLTIYCEIEAPTS